tara:strand:- start:1378 stop:1713 length:336 start_codon:yes stop_codon:yes gene_type:complete
VKLIKDSNRKGDFAEYYAVTWLWDNGYEVFKNSGCTGPVDMIAMDKKGKILLIDVKTAQADFRKTNKTVSCTKPKTKLQEKLGVKFLLFDPDTRELRFANHGIIGRPKHKQ